MIVGVFLADMASEAAHVRRRKMKAPTIAELRNDPVVRQVLEEAWIDSLPNDPARRHEEGGWIYMDVMTGAITTGRAPAGGQANLDLTSPPVLTGSLVVATFHTHPNPTSEGWDPGPSQSDTQSADYFGIPCLIRADNGVCTTGPDSRRGGLAGGPGYPP